MLEEMGVVVELVDVQVVPHGFFQIGSSEGLCCPVQFLTLGFRCFGPGDEDHGDLVAVSIRHILVQV